MRSLNILKALGMLGVLGVALTPALSARAQQDARCFSSNPSDWPPPARPYFMVIVDSSASMWQSVGSADGCGFGSKRIDHARCAVRRTIQTFSEVNFGLAQFASYMNNCSGSTCYTGCTSVDFPNNETGEACGPTNGTVVPNPAGAECNFGTTVTQRRGANILVPIEVDNATSPSNVPELLSWVDNNCTANKEIVQNGQLGGIGTPLSGSLRDVYRYFNAGWQRQDGALTHPSPLGPNDPACRSVNVILLTDGDEWCDPSANSGNELPAACAAKTLFNGFTKDGKQWKIPVYVINFLGGAKAKTDTIASYGGTNASYLASNEAELSTTFANIIASAIRPEVCNNSDDDCNGCIDEGYRHYCHRNKTPAATPTTEAQCCDWTTDLQRTACIDSYLQSISDTKPTGDRYKLPCYDPSLTSGFDAAQPLQDSDKWLCYNPGDTCDELDNNCEAATPATSVADENQRKCNGHCPVAETCNSEDDDCDNIIDNAPDAGTPFSLPDCGICIPTTEICDNLDNDCDGVIDNDVTPFPCEVPGMPGLIYDDQDPRSICEKGLQECGSSTCVGFVGPQAEICDDLDNDCDGVLNNGVPDEPCDVPGQPGLVYKSAANPDTVCERGTVPCNGQCQGYVGPSAEICDGLDNDCDGVVDNDPSGVNQPCGVVCGQAAFTTCESGALICRSNVEPDTEICDGIDNDCNGIVDDNVLDKPADAGCWQVPAGACDPTCSYQSTTWCPPDGATCTGLGTLTTPCSAGTLVCQSGGWRCVGGKLPEAEVCDAVDNNCDGTVDNGIATQPCGTDVGECTPGTQVCLNGTIQCQGGQGPITEICNAKDDDCDGVIDNGISIGDPCQAPYDTTLYPGSRDKGVCKPGHTECGPNGEIICVGGTGPSAELCDGLDNDCDGKTDELGAAPDGIDGTANPADATQVVGGPCGVDVGACKQGVWACASGSFACSGAVTPKPEICDCIDNDCDGTVDEDPTEGSGEPALCGTEKTCVAFQNGCQCAALCGGGEYPCPTGGFTCELVDRSGTEPPESAGHRCVVDGCANCSNQTVTAPGGAVECAPAGTTLDGGASPPACVCKQNSCHRPCFGVTCDSPLVCTDFGPNAGECVTDTCFNIPCVQGQACNLGTCVDNPCTSTSCSADQVCVPSADFASFECKGSCAGVSCDQASMCRGGTCVPTGCAEPCPAGQVCAGDEAGCVDSPCTAASCSDGSHCDPLTGECGNPPCTGVVCPANQQCQDGECVAGTVADAGPDAPVEGGGGSAGAAGAGGGGGAAGSAGSGTGGGPGVDGGTTPTTEGTRNWGLTTGGGGCACETGPATRSSGIWAALGAVGLALLGRRRRRKQDDDKVGNATFTRDGGER